MSETRHIVRLGPAARLLLYSGFGTILAFLLMIVLTPSVLAGLLFGFATGFYHFLAANLPRISANADTLMPGIAAFVIATLAGHRMIAGFYQKRGKHWPFSNTCCLAALLPVLFIIAFLVPGVILQLQLLAGEL
jgi:hypothetical protein